MLLPDVTKITGLKLIFRTLVALAFYSKSILLLSNHFTDVFPPTILALVTEYWESATSYAHQTSIIVMGAFAHVKDVIQEFKQDSLTSGTLQKEIKINNLQEINSTLEVRIDDLYHNSIQKDIFEKELACWQEKESELSSNNKILLSTNHKLELQNLELLENVKTSKLTSSIEKGQSVLHIIGNIGLISVQIINAYNSWYYPPAANAANAADIKLLMTAVNNLLSRLNTENVREDADLRAYSSRPNTELTDREIPLLD